MIYGDADKVWVYCDIDDSIIGYVTRHVPPRMGKKFIIPWTWDSIQRRWRNWNFRKPRPLYGLERLKDSPHAPVVLTSGEEAADAARKIARLENHIIMCGPMGSLRGVDFTSIYGRHVLLCPGSGNEKARKAMKNIIKNYNAKFAEVSWLRQIG